MFTGIVEELGSVRSRDGGKFEFAAKTVVDGVALGDSIAVNGVCLTVTAYGEDWFGAEAVDETLVRSSLGGLGRRRSGEPRTTGSPARSPRRSPRAGPRRRRG